MSGQRTVWTEKQYEEFLKTSKVPQPAMAGTVTLPETQKVTTGRTARRIKRIKTAAESEFELRLKADWPQMTILYETIKLKIDETCWFLPDFYIPQLQTFFEVKGSHVWEDSVIKFKAARAIHDWAVFQMWQKKEEIWTRLH